MRERSLGVHLASAALPAGGAYSIQSYLSFPAWIRYLAFVVRYTKAGATGQWKAKLMWAWPGFDGAQASESLLDPSMLVVAEPEALQKLYEGTFPGPIYSDAPRHDYTIVVKKPPCASMVRLLLAELAVPATPGVATIIAYAAEG